jgi:hypothetical protein
MGRAYRFLKEELDPKSMQLFLMINSSGRQIQAVNN